MDVICLKCGEPWDISTVYEGKRNYDAHLRNIKDGFGVPDSPTHDGWKFSLAYGAPIECPCCKENMKENEGKPCRSEDAMLHARVVAELLGDDLDGLACELEDYDAVHRYDEPESPPEPPQAPGADTVQDPDTKRWVKPAESPVAPKDELTLDLFQL